MDHSIKQTLKNAKNLAEVQDILKDCPEVNADRVWKELENHRSASAKGWISPNSTFASGGADRGWVKEGCAATCEESSWRMSNDYCMAWETTYDNFWATCPDGHEHVFQDDKCTRCGYMKSRYYDRK